MYVVEQDLEDFVSSFVTIHGSAFYEKGSRKYLTGVAKRILFAEKHVIECTCIL